LETVISFAVPVKPVTRFVPLSLICEAVTEIAVLPAAVRRPCASTVNVATVPAPPYEPPVTVVLSRFKVIVSVAPATEVKPVPPEIVNVSVPEVIVWFDPESPETVNDVATFETTLLILDTCWST
jgi:hypothetical protein